MAISDRKKREKEQRRQSIIDAAEKLFSEKGYDNVSINDIAKEVELNRATIYLYFENKEALCFAVLLRGMRILNEMIKANVRKTLAIQKIYTIGNAYYSFFQIYPQYFEVYIYFQSGRFKLSKMYDFETGYYKTAVGDIHEILKLQKEIFDMVHSAIQTEKGGKISSDVDPKYATILIMSTMDSMLNPSPVLENELVEMKLNKYQNFNMIFIHFINRLLRNRQYEP